MLLDTNKSLFNISGTDDLQKEISILTAKAKKNAQRLWVAFAVVFAAFLFLAIHAWFNKDKPAKIERLEAKAEKMQIEMKELHIKADSLQAIVKEGREQIADIEEREIAIVDLYNENIDKLYEIQKQKQAVNRVDNFSSADIISYFNEHYPPGKN